MKAAGVSPGLCEIITLVFSSVGLHILIRAAQAVGICSNECDSLFGKSLVMKKRLSDYWEAQNADLEELLRVTKTRHLEDDGQTWSRILLQDSYIWSFKKLVAYCWEAIFCFLKKALQLNSFMKVKGKKHCQSRVLKLVLLQYQQWTKIQLKKKTMV